VPVLKFDMDTGGRFATGNIEDMRADRFHILGH
jgi:hypothetical protein